MKRLLAIPGFLLMAVATFAQKIEPRLEAYSGAGIFIEGLNNDTLVPLRQRGLVRLGDVSMAGLQVTEATRNKRWLFKVGAGYSARHYSMSKYTLVDFFADLFLFDSRPPVDTSSISRARLTNQYLQVPISAAFTIIRRRHGTGGPFTVGVNFNNDILLKSSAQFEFDDSYPQPTPATIAGFQKLYTQNASGYVLSIQPYLEGSFFVYKRIGLFEQARFFSYYSSPLDKKFTAGTIELLSFTVGLMYDFNR